MGIEPFEHHVDEYEAWFERNRDKYALEVRAVRPSVPPGVEGLEVGVGTGRFAAPLGVGTGVEPSRPMAERARRLGIRVVEAVAESLPFPDRAFDVVLMVTTVCFVDDLDRSLREARRVSREGGRLVVGFVDRESALGKTYLAKRAQSRFYGAARFYSTLELLEALARAGFHDFGIRQTLLPADATVDIEPGYGRGGFVVIQASKGPVPHPASIP